MTNDNSVIINLMPAAAFPANSYKHEGCITYTPSERQHEQLLEKLHEQGSEKQGEQLPQQ